MDIYCKEDFWNIYGDCHRYVDDKCEKDWKCSKKDWYDYCEDDHHRHNYAQVEVEVDTEGYRCGEKCDDFVVASLHSKHSILKYLHKGIKVQEGGTIVFDFLEIPCFDYKWYAYYDKEHLKLIDEEYEPSLFGIVYNHYFVFEALEDGYTKIVFVLSDGGYKKFYLPIKIKICEEPCKRTYLTGGYNYCK